MKRRRMITVLMVVIFWGVLRPVPVKAVTVQFQPIMDDIANPERGFMKQANIRVDQAFSAGSISTVAATDTLVWVYFHLEGYRDPRDGKGVQLPDYQGKLLEPIGSGRGLDTVQAAFSEARKKGLKLVIRFLYLGYGGLGSNSNPSSCEPDMPIEWVQQHIGQLKPVVEANKDVVAAIQMGWVGYWGEWHSSKYLYDLAIRKRVMEAMLANMPNDRMIQVRYPRYKQVWWGGPVTVDQAFDQSDVARIAFHDDAFLKDDTDDGTFKSSTGGSKVTTYCDNFPGGEAACWKDYVAKDTAFVASGGEAGTHSSTPSTYAQCPNALPIMENLHISFLHNGYSKVVLDNWVKQGCMPEIRRRMGYRFALTSVTIPQTASPGTAMPLKLEMENQGFAVPYNFRPVYLVLKEKNSGSTKEIALPSVDPRRWLPGQKTVSDITVSLPGNLSNGNYIVYLWMPDADVGIKNRPEYAIRLANANVWSGTSGLNQIFDGLQVGGGPPPGKPGDANGDGKVDGADYAIWLQYYGRTTNLGAREGDFNTSGKVDGADYAIWLQYYGT